MNWQKIFTDYWSQITLLLLAVSYFIKRVFDVKSKKTEINHTLFQQNRINGVSEFFKNYAKVELMWKQLEIWNILAKKIPSSQMDEIIFPPLRDLRQSVLNLRIYFDKEQHKDFEQIMTYFLGINGKLAELYSWPPPDNSIGQNVTVFNAFRDELIERNEKLLDKICTFVRATFN